MPLALPPGLHADVAGVHLDAALALGAQALVYVGDASDVTRYDAVATETVRVVPAAVSVTVTRPLGAVDAWAALRMEEGTVHAGGLEAAEARVGVTRGGWLGAWVGRADLPLSFDREYEAEDLTFSVRPLLSRAVLPLHATGAGLTVDGLGATHPVGSLELGASYASLTSDAPYWWGRVDVHPWGPMPEAQAGGDGAVRAQLGGAVSWLDSPSVGTQLYVDVDLALAAGPVDADGGWIRVKDTSERAEAWAGLGVRAVRWTGGDLHLAVRGERVTGLEDGEEARFLGAGRVATRFASLGVQAYVEGTLSREVGHAAAGSEDVVVIDDTIERANDTLAVGMLFRW